MFVDLMPPIVADTADGADGADGVIGSVLTYGRHPDCSRSEPPLAAEDDLDPEGAEEGLCPAQPTSECAGALWPARSVVMYEEALENIVVICQALECRSDAPRVNDGMRWHIGLVQWVRVS